MFEQLGKRLFHRLSRIVNADGVQRWNQRPLPSIDIQLIAIRGGFVSPILHPLLACGRIGIEKKLDGGQGKNFGPNITAFHDQGAKLETVPLPGDHPVSNFPDLGNDGHRFFHRIGTDFSAWEVSRHVKPKRPFHHPQFGFPSTKCRQDGFGGEGIELGGCLGYGHMLLKAVPGECSVHRT
jgi:hypothetical protein